MAYTRVEFAQRIKNKYPVYKEIDDDELVNKILAKYPQYESEIQEPEVTTAEWEQAPAPVTPVQEPVQEPTIDQITPTGDADTDSFILQVNKSFRQPKREMSEIVEPLNTNITSPLKELAKGIAGGTEQAIGSLGKITSMLSEIAFRDKFDDALRNKYKNTPELIEMLDRFDFGEKEARAKLSEKGKAWAKRWEDATQEGFSAPTSGVTFKTAPISKTFQVVGEALPLYATAIAATITTKSPVIAGAMFGTVQAADTFSSAKKAGFDREQARTYALMDGAWTGLSEAIPFNRLLGSRGLGILKRMGKGAIEEGVQEVVQEVGSNLIAKYGYDKGREVFENWLEALVGGAVLGAGGGAMVRGSDVSPRQDLINQRLKEVGVEILVASKAKDTKAQLKLTKEQESLQKELNTITSEELTAAMQSQEEEVIEEPVAPVVKEPIAPVEPVEQETKVKTAGERIQESKDRKSEELKAKEYSENVPIEDVEKYIKQEGIRKSVGTEEYEALKKDIKENGIKEPIVIGYDAEKKVAEVVEGNHRYTIAKELGLKDIPVVVQKTGVLRGGVSVKEYTGSEYNIRPSEIGIGETIPKKVVDKNIPKEITDLGPKMVDNFTKAVLSKEGAKKVLYPVNKISRKAWTEYTGVDLPPTLRDTHLVIDDYFDNGTESAQKLAKTFIGGKKRTAYRNIDGKFEKFTGEEVDIREDIETVVSKSKTRKGYIVTELQTGLSLGYGDTKKSAIKTAKDAVNKVSKEEIKALIDKSDKSPYKPDVPKVDKNLPTSDDEMVDYLTNKYPDGINLYHQTSADSAKAIEGMGFVGDKDDNVYFNVEKYDNRRSTNSNNEKIISIKLLPKDYGAILPDYGTYEGESDNDIIADMFKQGFVGADITLPTDVANNYKNVLKVDNGGIIKEEGDNNDIIRKSTGTGEGVSEPIGESGTVSTEANGNDEGRGLPSEQRTDTGRGIRQSIEKIPDTAIDPMSVLRKDLSETEIKKPLPITPQEANNYIYEQKGGKKGAEGVEILSAYFTPEPLSNIMQDAITKYIPISTGYILEPSVGDGGLITNLSKNHSITAVELNQRTANIVKAKYPKSRVYNTWAEKFFHDNKEKFDAVIMNPPYNEYHSLFKGVYKDKGASTYTDYFLRESSKVLNNNGVMVVLMPHTFLKSSSSPVKRIMESEGMSLKEAFRLPDGIFGKSVKIPIDLVVFKKDNIDNSILWDNNQYFKQFPEKVLGEITEGKGFKGRPVEIIKGDIEEAYKKIREVMDLGKVTQPTTKPEIAEAKPIEKATEKKAPAIKESSVKTITDANVKKVQTSTNDRAVKNKSNKNIEVHDVGDFKLAEIFSNVDYDGNVPMEYTSNPAELNYYDGKVKPNIYYVFGNIRERLVQLEADRGKITPEQYDKQKKLLESVLPEYVKAKDMELDPRLEYFVKRDPQNRIDRGEGVSGEFADWLRNTTPYDKNVSYQDVIDYINNRPVTGFRTETKADRAKRASFIEKRRHTAIKFFSDYLDFLSKTPEGKLVVDKINYDMFSNHVPSFLDFPFFVKGITKKFKGNPLIINKHQIEAINFLYSRGVGYFAGEVGAGKTMASIVAVEKMIQDGKASRPIIMAPKKVVKNFEFEYSELFPNRKIVNVGNMSKFSGGIEDGTVYLATKEALAKITYEDETLEEIKKWLSDQVINDADDKRKKEIASLMIDELFISKVATGKVFFEDLNFDLVVLDEAHYYKNLFTLSDKEFKSFSSPQSAIAARAYILATNILRNNNNRNVIMLSATPFNNQAVEIYNVLSFIGYGKMQDMGISNIGDFVSTYAKTDMEWVLGVGGEFDKKQVTTGFKNANSLRQLLRTYMLPKFADDLDLVRPEKKRVKLIVKSNQLTDDLNTELTIAMEAAPKEQMIGFFSQFRNLTVSPYLVNIGPDINTASTEEIIENSPKMKEIVDQIESVYKSNNDASQIVYFLIGKKLMAPMKAYLIKHKGFKPHQVEIVEAKPTSPANERKDKQVEADFNNGKIKVILGTSVIKEGLNLQTRGAIIYHPLIDWNPTGVLQVEGRIYRQGNLFEWINSVFVLLENGMDSKVLQIMEEKSRRFNDLWEGRENFVDVSDVNPETLKLDLITDPEAKANMAVALDKEKVDDEIEIKKADLRALPRRLEKIDIKRYMILANYADKINKALGETFITKEDLAVEYETNKKYDELYKSRLETAYQNAKDTYETENPNTKFPKRGESEGAWIKKNKGRLFPRLPEKVYIKTINKYFKPVDGEAGFYFNMPADLEGEIDYGKYIELKDKINQGQLDARASIEKEIEELQHQRSEIDNRLDYLTEEYTRARDKAEREYKPPEKLKAPEYRDKKNVPPKSYASAGEDVIKDYAKNKKSMITNEQIRRANKKVSVKKVQQSIEDAKDAREAVHEMIIQRRTFIDLKLLETNEFVHNINQVTTKAQREIIPFLIEKTGIPTELERPDLEEIMKAEKSTPKLSQIVNQVRKHFDEGWEFLKQHSDLMDIEQIENYVTHLWDIPKSKKKMVSNYFTTRNKFLKKRYIETLQMGIAELGLKPKILDIGEIIRIHDSVMNKVIANNKFVKSLNNLRKDGVPLIERIDKAPADWVKIDHPALRKVFVKPSAGEFGEKISPELQDILMELGVAIGRRLSPTIFGKPNAKQGEYISGERPEIRLQRWFDNRTVAHEIGHHLSISLDIGEEFLNQFKNEIYAVNKRRIEKLSVNTGKWDKAYAETTEEQIAEFFAMLLTTPEETINIAPNASAEILNMLRKNETLTKLVDLDFEVDAKNLIEEQMSMLIKLPVAVHPDLVKPLKVIFNSRIDNAVVNAIQIVNAVLKKTQLSLSLFHAGALTETAIAIQNPYKAIKNIVMSKHAVWKNIDLSKDAVSHGLQLGASNDIPIQKIQGWLDTLALRNKNIPILKQATQAIASFNKGWDVVLWEYVHDGLKLYGYEHLVSQLPLTTKDVTKAKREIAQFVNDTYGGQNWDLLMIDPQLVQMMSLALLSPDWQISTIRQALSPFGVGSTSPETKQLRKKMGRSFWIKVALYYGLGINLLNYLFYAYDHKDDENDKREVWKRGRFMWNNAYGHKTHLYAGKYSDGKERYIRWGKQFRELPELLIDPIKKIGGKASPFFQLFSQVFTGKSLSSFTNRDIGDKKGIDKAMGIVKTILKSPFPFSTRSLFEKNKEFYFTDLMFPSSKGMSAYGARHLFRAAIMAGDERMVSEVYSDALDNNLDAYALFESALSSVKADNTRDINSGIKTKKEAIDKYNKSKNERERKTLKRKIKRLEKQEEHKYKADKLLEKAINDLRISTDTESGSQYR